MSFLDRTVINEVLLLLLFSFSWTASSGTNGASDGHAAKRHGTANGHSATNATATTAVDKK